MSKDVLISTIKIQNEALDEKERRLETQAEYIGWLLAKMDEFGCKPTAYEIQKFTETLKGKKSLLFLSESVDI